MIDHKAIDDSIGYMTEMRSLCSVPDGNVAKAYDTALACMRECAERREGCVFCNDERHRIREVFDEGTAKIIDAENHYALSVDTSRDAAIFNIFYCPVCGKRLEVEP